MKNSANIGSVYLFICAALAGLNLSVMPVAMAETLQVEYKSFYGHVRKLKGEDTAALQFAFGFINIRSKTLCNIESARISTEKVQIPLIVKQNRFTVPSERALNLAKAMVIIDLDGPANICDMSVQLETKPEYLADSYSKEDLDFLFNQYTAFFDNMGSFLSFMMPKVEGLSIYFTDTTLNANLENGIIISEGKLTLKEQQLSIIEQLNLPTKALRVTAITSK
jgi:hypothetical protein